MVGELVIAQANQQHGAARCHQSFNLACVRPHTRHEMRLMGPARRSLFRAIGSIHEAHQCRDVGVTRDAELECRLHRLDCVAHNSIGTSTYLDTT